MRFHLPLALLALCSCAADKGRVGNKPDPSRYPAARVESGGINVSYASTDGRFVGLSDGSMWNIDWQRAGVASGWRRGEPIRVSSGGSGSFPYRLTDRNGRSVPARLGKRLD